MPYKGKLVLTAHCGCISCDYLVHCEVKSYHRVTSCFRSKCCSIISWLSKALSMPYKRQLVLTAYCCCISCDYLVHCEVKSYHTVTSCLRSKCCSIVSRCID